MNYTYTFLAATFALAANTQAATTLDVDYAFASTGTQADQTITGLSVTTDGASFTFDLFLDGTLDDGSSGLQLSSNGGTSILIRGDDTAANSTGTIAFSLTNVVETTATGKTLVLDGIAGGRFSNFQNVTTKSFLADRTYNSDVDGPGGTGEFQLNFDNLATSNLIDGSGTANFRMHDVDLQLSAVPEPSSTALLGLGGLALMMRRRR